MIQDYKELKMRKELDLRFEEYKQDWKYKDQIEQGDFIPSVELYEDEISLLLRMCNHAITLNKYQLLIISQVENLRDLLTAKKAAHETGQLETCHTLLESEKQLDTMLFILSESRREIVPFGSKKGQVSLGF